MNKAWVAWLTLGGAAIALALTHFWGLRRRASGMRKFAESRGLSYSESSGLPSGFPAHDSSSELRNAIRGTLDGHDLFIVDEEVHAGRSSHIRAVVGFKNYSSAYREWYDVLRLWQVYPGDGWIWVYRRWCYVPEKSLQRFIEKAWKKASARLT